MIGPSIFTGDLDSVFLREVNHYTTRRTCNLIDINVSSASGMISPILNLLKQIHESLRCPFPGFRSCVMKELTTEDRFLSGATTVGVRCTMNRTLDSEGRERGEIASLRSITAVR
jgi:hypothetical protein